MEYKKGLASVIVPVYKVEKYLDDCIKSLINQTYTNFEAILVDDGSPDECPKICDKWAEIDNRIKVIHQKNGGLSNARNKGLGTAWGEFIAFLDGDDMYAPGFLEEGIKALQDKKTEIYFCRYSKVPEDTKYVNLQRYDGAEAGIGIVDVEGFWKRYREAKTNELISSIAVWSKIYRRELFENERFVEGVLHEDERILHHIIDQCSSISYTEKAKYYYRKARESIMESDFSVRNLDFAEGMLERLAYFKREGNIEALIFDWGRGGRCLLRGYNELDKSNLAVKERLIKIRREYFKWASYIRKNTSSIRVKIQMIMFNGMFDIYRRLQKIKVKSQ